VQESGLFGYSRQLAGVFNEIFLQIDRCSHMHYYASVLRPRATKDSPVARSSEHQPQAELDVTGRAHGAGNHSRAGAPDTLARQIELGMIQQVEELAPELQAESLGDRKLLENRKIYEDLRYLLPRALHFQMAE